jgi:aminodeoxychorismate lyase
MILFLNGKLVPEELAVVSVLDRGFLYGDGLFESIRVANGKPFRWGAHLERFERGARFLKIQPPFSRDQLLASALQLVEANSAPEALLRIVLSRGAGLRGYSAVGANTPAMVMSIHPVPGPRSSPPSQWRLATASFLVHSRDPLTQFKTCNKLTQVLARTEAENAAADEALLLDEAGLIAETSSGNIFWIDAATVCTPPLATGVLPGVTRLVVLELCNELGMPTREISMPPTQLLGMQGAFVSLSSWGIVEVSHLDGRKLQTSPITQKLRAAYQSLLQAETA